MKRALILGITGQDGSYLADILLERGYEVHGLYRRTSVDNLTRIHHILDKVILHRGDLLDASSMRNAIESSEPHEIYNVADQDDVRWSYHTPLQSYSTTFGAVGVLLDLVSHHARNAKVFQPVSATMFEGSPFPQNERTPLNPQSPYACAKAGVYHLAGYYRNMGLKVWTGIMFNHDSPRRGEGYLIQKICRSVLDKRRVALGDLSGRVDVGYALEFMEGVHKMLQDSIPGNYVIGTGRSYTVKQLAQFALEAVGAPINNVEDNPSYSRASTLLIADIHKARQEFGLDPKYHGRKLINVVLEGMKK